MIQQATLRLAKADLGPIEMSAAMEEIMSAQAKTAQIVSFLRALSNRGETVSEITAAAKVMRKHAVKINSRQKPILDTCGTGGDAKGTFNISTAVALVASGSGVVVAKHGNRAISSCCGSADILEASGVNINLTPEALTKCLDELGIAFLFAQNLHPAMKYAMPARKQIKSRTIFNLLGPLSNPAGATHQLVGVYAQEWVEAIAAVLANLGSAHALVVHGADGLDEITTTDKTFIAEARAGKVKSYFVSPEDFGIERSTAKDLSGGDINHHLKILQGVLSGKPGPCRDIVVLNAAAAIYVADKASSIKDGLILAKDSIDSGKALEKLELLRNFS